MFWQLHLPTTLLHSYLQIPHNDGAHDDNDDHVEGVRFLIMMMAMMMMMLRV